MRAARGARSALPFVLAVVLLVIVVALGETFEPLADEQPPGDLT